MKPKEVAVRDTHRRSITKAVIYRGGSICLLSILSWITTKDLIQTSIIAVGYQVFSVVGYYFYERIWERIKWGRQTKKKI